MKDALLRRYWFPASVGFGVGVTAFSLEEARDLAQRGLLNLPSGATLGDPEPDVEIPILDQSHVVPNMGICTVRGIWYPKVVLE